MINSKYDLVVIGTGTAASTTAAECSSAGWKVAVIDSLPFGGTCALRGCEPKKVLLEAAKIIDSSKRHEDKGISGSAKIQVKWSDLIRFKKTFTEFFPRRREDSYIKAGIDPYHGHAQFIGPNAVAVDGQDSKSITLTGKYILIATGAKPMHLNIPGSENIITSDDFLDFEGDSLPDRIVFVGGGYISFEFAHIAARAGSNVTILHRGIQPLEHFDPDLVNLLVERSKEIGIDIRLQSTIEKIEKKENGKFDVEMSNTSTTSNVPTIETKVEADMIVHGAGRQANIEGLNLKTAGVDHTVRGIQVNEYLQSVSNPSVYAAGDVADSGGFPLTPVATYEGSLVATNLIKGNSLKSNYNGLASVVFTIPPLASVGLQEKEAKDKGLQFRTNYGNTSSWASSRRIGETCSGFKVIIEEKSNRILGAHIVGPHAEEVINLFSMAIRLALTAKDLNDALMYAYPTNSSDIVYML